MPRGLDQAPTFAADYEYQSAPASADFCFAKRRFRKLREAPYDSNGVPLPLIPSENFNKIPIGSPALSKHHEHYLYGSQNFISLGGIALRGRILRAETEVHNGPRGLHHYWDMSPGPRSNEGRIRALVLYGASYLPEEGIDLWSGSPEIRVMEPDERDILTTPSSKNPNYYRNVICDNAGMRKFFEKLILKQPLHGLDMDQIEAIAKAKRLGLVYDLSNSLLRDLISTAVSGADSAYQEAKNRNLLHPDAPESPTEVVFKTLGDEDKIFATLHPLVRQKAKRHLDFVNGSSGSAAEESLAA